MTDDARGMLVLAVAVCAALAGFALWLAGSVQRSRLVERYQPTRGRSPAELLAALDSQLVRLAPARALAEQLRSSGVRESVAIAVVIGGAALVAGILAGQYVVGNTVGAIAGGVLAGYGLRSWLTRARRRWRERLEDQLPDLARQLGAATAAGISTARAVERAAAEIKDPMAAELRRVVAETRLGHPLDDALKGLADRLALPDLTMLVATIVIQHSSGGDVARALRELAATLEGRDEVRREIRTKLAGVRGGPTLIAGLCGGLMVMVNQAQPGTLNTLTTSPVGLFALAFTGFLLLLVKVIVDRLTKVQV